LKARSRKGLRKGWRKSTLTTLPVALTFPPPRTAALPLETKARMRRKRRKRRRRRRKGGSTWLGVLKGPRRRLRCALSLGWVTHGAAGS